MSFLSRLNPFGGTSVPLFRSEDMSYVSVTVTNDAAHETLHEIGKLGRFHFVDLTAGQQTGAPSKQHLTYKKRLQDCMYWEKKLASFREEMKRRGVDIPTDDTERAEISSADLMDDISQFLDPIERELVLSAGFAKDNQRQISELIERQLVLCVTQSVRVADVAEELNDEADARGARDMNSSLLASDDFKRDDDADRLRNFIAGTIPVEAVEQMKRMLYRISRGNAIAKFVDIDEVIVDPATGEEMKKSVFWIVFLGEQLNTRIRKMCEIIHATIYETPNNREETERVLDLISQELVDKRSIHTRTEDSIFNLLNRLAWDNNSSPLLDWEFAVLKEKMICNIFMKCHFYLTMIAVEGWCPTAEINDFKEACRAAVIGTGHPPAAIEVNPANPLMKPDTPPTYFRLNKFTATFQGIVDTYGVPRYKEANPGLFTVISFPFLFGVMYGDIGHGVLITLFALFLVRSEAKLEKSRRAGTLGEIPSMAFGGRYVILMMGCFAIFCGMIYNDCMSIPTHVYPSSWGNITEVSFTNSTHFEKLLTIYPIHNQTYPLGVDPAWYHKQNSLAFFNSMKMKMAVILGVVQMTFGLFLMLSNHLYFGDRLGIFFEFLPRFVFLMATFGYMDFMIIYKWCIDWIHFGNPYFVPAVGQNMEPPNLIQTMINMFLSAGKIEPNQALYDKDTQVTVQAVLAIAALLSVPFMLCGKPCAHRYQNKKLMAARAMLGSEDDSDDYQAYSSPRSSSRIINTDSISSDADGTYEIHDSGTLHDDEDIKVLNTGSAGIKEHPSNGSNGHSGGGGGHGHGDGEYSFSDEMIHNAIHTIEFVLGCVSNTASYLRLWALSLAHAQLAEVFWNKMIMQYGITGGTINAFAGWAVWAVATFAVLLCMDTLECFLHALRLHWVEFQNKFYFADGRAFEPFAFVPSDF